MSDKEKPSSESKLERPLETKRWYVVQAYSGFEKFVKASLEERIRIEKIEDKFEEIIVPTEEVIEMRAGQKRKSQRKFFPGYVLVKMEMDDQTWHLVRKTPTCFRYPRQGS